MRFAYTIAEAFQIKDRGLVLISGPHCEPQAKLLIGCEIEIRQLDGKIIRTTVRGIEMASPNPHRYFAIMVPAEISKEDVPPGAEVWSNEESHV